MNAYNKNNGLILTGGGVASAQGFSATGVKAGFYPNPEKLDLAVIAADEPCAAAATFTKNVFCAAPVTISKEHLGSDSCGTAQVLVINSGNANAATGQKGLQAAEETCQIAAEVFGCTDEDVLVASTGVIGQYIDSSLFADALPHARAQVDNAEGGNRAARAIMTTDTVAKEFALVYTSADPELDHAGITIGGMAKGSGMIMPDMATLIAVVTTDAPLAPYDLRIALKRAVGASFNKVTIDTDTSTNDCCYAFASGKASNTPIKQGTLAFEEFCEALSQVCSALARMIAEDGEGATRLITVNVNGAISAADADVAARAVANSPLVKTAVYGHDANWGRIAMALGKSGALFEQEKVDIDIMGIPVCRDGLAVAFSEEDAEACFDAHEIIIDCDLGAGNASTTIWTCDYSHEYISINGDYRT